MENDLECKEDDLQELESPRDGFPLIKGHHTPPHLVYNIYPETPATTITYKFPSNSPVW